MALKKVANTDMDLRLTLITGPTDISPGTIQDIDLTQAGVSATQSTSNEAPSGKAICTEKVNANFTAAGACPFTSGTHTFLTGIGSINSDAIATKSDGKFVLREGNTGACAGTWQPPSTPPASIPCSCTFAIQSAGQNAVEAE